MSAEMNLELPEINRRVYFTASYTSGPTALGCHAGTITGVKLEIGRGGKIPAEILDPSLEKKGVKITHELYGGHYLLPDETKRITDYMNANDIDYRKLPNFFDSLLVKTQSIPIWVLSDVINAEAPGRAFGSVVNPGRPNSLTKGHTTDFVKWLIANGKGYVQGSPIVQNPLHRMAGNYSLNQVWFWIHPKHLERSVRGTAFQTGDDVFPDWDTWYKTVQKDIGGGAGLDSLEKVKDYVLGDTRMALVPPKRRLFTRKELPAV